MFSRSNALACVAGVMVLGMSAWAHAAGDPAAGEKKFYTCYGCHGLPNYRNAYPDYSVPMLRHQNAAYITAALQEYRSGERPHPTMHAQAASLSDQDIADIAAYLQGTEPVKANQQEHRRQDASASRRLYGLSWRERHRRGIAADAAAAGVGRPACRLPGTGAHHLPQRPPQERGHGQHGPAFEKRRRRENCRGLFREPGIAADHCQYRQQVAFLSYCFSVVRNCANTR